MQLYEEPPDARVVIFSKGKILTEREPIPSPGIDEAPLSIGDSSGHERSPLEALSLPDGATVRPEPIKRPQPTGKPAAASILTEGSLNDSRNKVY